MLYDELVSEWVDEYLLTKWEFLFNIEYLRIHLQVRILFEFYSLYSFSSTF